MYPSCIKIENIVNMMVCVHNYELDIITPFTSKSNIIDKGFYLNAPKNGLQTERL